MDYYIDDRPAEPTGLTPEELKEEIKKQEIERFGHAISYWPEDGGECYVIAIGHGVSIASGRDVRTSSGQDGRIAWRTADIDDEVELTRQLQQEFPGIHIAVMADPMESEVVESLVEFERALRKIVNRAKKRKKTADS